MEIDFGRRPPLWTAILTGSSHETQTLWGNKCGVIPGKDSLPIRLTYRDNLTYSLGSVGASCVVRWTSPATKSSLSRSNVGTNQERINAAAKNPKLT